MSQISLLGALIFIIASVILATVLCLAWNTRAEALRRPGDKIASDRCWDIWLFGSLSSWCGWSFLLYGSYTAGILDPLLALQPLILRCLLFLLLAIVPPWCISTSLMAIAYPVVHAKKEPPRVWVFESRSLRVELYIAAAGVIPFLVFILVRSVPPHPVLFVVIAGLLFPALTGLFFRLMGPVKRLDRGDLVERVKEQAVKRPALSCYNRTQ